MSDYNPNTTDYYSYNGQHVHELIGSTVFTEKPAQRHNHRFTTMSGGAVEAEGSHFHNVTFHTDTHDDHYHKFHGPSSLAIPIGDGRHVHFTNGYTESVDNHTHEFRAATLINHPTQAD